MPNYGQIFRNRNKGTMSSAARSDLTLLTPTHFPAADAYTSVQMQLFQSFHARDSETRQRLSNSLDFWDAIPKYSVNRQGGGGPRGPATAPPSILTRHFEFRNHSFQLEIRPARVRHPRTGAISVAYPTLREEIVEDALRKIASQQQNGFYCDGPGQPRAGVRFTLNALRKYLKGQGHTLGHDQVKESLLILADCHIEVMTIDGPLRKQINASIIRTLIFSGRADLAEDPGCLCYADFHPLITDAIDAIQYRQFDLSAVLQHRKPLARWLHKYFIRAALNASPLHPIKLSMTFVKTASGLLGATRWRDDVRTLRAAIAELIDNQVLIAAQACAEPAGAADADLRWLLTPSASLVADIIAANQRCQHHRSLATPAASGPGPASPERTARRSRGPGLLTSPRALSEASPRRPERPAPPPAPPAARPRGG